MQRLAGGKKGYEGKQRGRSAVTSCEPKLDFGALEKYPPALSSVTEGCRVTKQKTPSLRTGSPFLRLSCLHLLWSGSFPGFS